MYIFVPEVPNVPILGTCYKHNYGDKAIIQILCYDIYYQRRIIPKSSNAEEHLKSRYFVNKENVSRRQWFFIKFHENIT